jgi:hypothetical protein
VVAAQPALLAAARAGWPRSHGNCHSEAAPRFQSLSDARLQLDGNSFPLANIEGDARPRLRELFAWTTHIGMIRERATVICIGLQDLELPAFVTLSIVDEAVPENEIRMWAKWELITTVFK